ncbi:YciI family protein [Pendulispora albinea]|uniref:YciI family protein n=1 Tax=Pendulispora albinea TaxID=2741071 RepID=A0ABZ2LT64_9BACT
MADFIYLYRGGNPPSEPDEVQKQTHKWLAWMKELGANGHVRAGNPLERHGKVVRGKSKTVTDGPFAEAKDLVGGYLLVHAKDFDEALELSKGCPILDMDGTVEVRAIHLVNVPAVDGDA